MKNAFSRALLLISLIAMALILSACGGGGVDGDGGIMPISDDIRFYQFGDRIFFYMTKYFPSSGAYFTGNVLWEIFDDNVINPFTGDLCFIYDIRGTLQGGSGVIDIGTGALFAQDGAGSLYTCGKYDPFNDEVIFATEPLKRWIESPVRIGNVEAGTVFYSDGSWEFCTIRVEGAEVVSTGAGRFEAFRISETCNDSFGRARSGTNWFYPPIYYIKSGSTDFESQTTFDMQSYDLR